ncbi:Uncharacterised protein [Raoultella terrigena]|uniref:Cellulose biosynthesis protein BcsO n=1 Tax=Raoultella terrigena TaxID=577 RepID=A0A4U9D5A2_RAOTE|nr:Uncharacterised protein [Raoultella terrigena]
MNHYDDLQRFKEKTRTQSLHFKDLSSQSAAREQGDWVILNQLAPGEKESSLAMGGSVSLPLPQQVPADTFLWVEAAPAQAAPEPTPPILTPEPTPAAAVVVPAAVAPSPVAQAAAPAEAVPADPRCCTNPRPCTGYSARAFNELAAIRCASSAAGRGRLCALICDESR